LAEFILGSSLRKLARKNGRLQGLLWRLDFAFIWLLIQCFAILPVDTASGLGERIGRWIGPRMKRKSLISRENMSVAFPELGTSELDSLVVDTWGRAGRILAEYPHLAAIIADPKRLIIDIRHNIETYSNPQRPSIFITSHQSNWEVSASTLSRMGIPSASLYSPPTNPHLDTMLLESRRALGCELLPRENSTRAVMRALKQGRSIGMVADRRIDQGESITFFGHDKPSTIMPAWLALKFNCDLVPVQVERLKDARYRVTMYAPLQASDTSADLKSQAIDMTQQAHQYFEKWARQCPQDWFCSKRMWPKNDRKASNVAPEETKVDSHAV
jgi:KDO2-lipid IV(A) lauroyltransferase